MKRVGLAAAGLAVGLVVGVVAYATGDRDPYASLRQASAEQIPGALGYELQPPPSNAHPELTPEQVERRYPADGGEVQVAFATVRDTLEGRSIGPGWVLLARGVCLRDAKGELVSGARGTGPSDLACTDATIWILAVDPTTAEPLVALTAYDETGTWHADVAG